MNRREFFRTAAGICALPLVALLPKSQPTGEEWSDEADTHWLTADYTYGYYMAEPLEIELRDPITITIINNTSSYA